MKLDKKFKCIIVFIIIAILGFSWITTSYGGSYEESMSDLITKQDTWSDTTKTDAKVQNITGTVIASARIIGICVAVVMLLVIAMKYMSAAPSEKADIKKSAVVYVVGAVVLFAVVGILEILENFSQAITAK